MPLVRLAVVAVMVCSVGCSRNKGKLEGTKWTSQATTLNDEIIPAGRFQFEFKKDKRLVLSVGSVTYTGTYSLGSRNVVAFRFDKEVSGWKTHAQKVVIDGNQMTMSGSDGSMTFYQVK